MGDAHSAGGASSKKTVLIVDDDPGQRLGCRELLEQEGYEVKEAIDGAQALDLLLDRKHALPSLILLDLSMPVMDGWQFLAVVKSYIRLHGIPVILVSAYEPTLDPVNHGTIAACLHKPYDPEELIALVGRFAVS